MGIIYNKLSKLPIDRNINKGKFCETIKISLSYLVKLQNLT